jgi:selenide,water dikinase
VGIIATAIKRDLAPAEVAAAAVASMTASNAEAAGAALAAGATGATDVTGFGLLGHLARMAEESQVDVTVDVDAVPLLPGARTLAEEGCVPGGSRRNLDWVGPRLDRGEVDEVAVLLLADAQTSGGLLFGAEPEAAAAAAVERLLISGHQAAIVGHARSGSGRLRLVSDS